MSNSVRALPPGQRAGEAFPRFGAVFRGPPPRPTAEPTLRITGAVESEALITSTQLAGLPRRDQTSDLHCVTTWTKPALRWSGWSMRDVYRELVEPLCRPRPEGRFLVLFGLDGYRCTLHLEDALADDVLVADRLDGEPLSSAHGAPLRVVSPRQYAYKSLKHLCGLGVRSEPPVGLRFGLEHPRGRVALEERHAHLPAPVVRLPYRLLIGPVAFILRRRLTSSDMVGRPTLLDGILPGPDVHELHDLWLDASTEDAYRALIATTGREIRLLGLLTALRRLPARLSGRTTQVRRERPVIDTLLESGFVKLAEEPGREIVLGVIGQFWKPADTHLQPVTGRDSFMAFDRPGFARAGMNFLLRAEGRGCRLITETRVAGTDASAARRFRRYWRLIRLGSGAIRRSWLAAVRRRLAES